MAAPIPTPVYHLTHIDNLASIIQSGGCLSFNRKQNQGIGHIDVAYETIQVRRAQTSVPCGSGGCLHDYVPFFFAPRPPMLYAIYRTRPKAQAAGGVFSQRLLPMGIIFGNRCHKLKNRIKGEKDA